MSRWADWIAITPEVAEQFIWAQVQGDEAIYRLLDPYLERREDSQLRFELDKTWEPIHRCLTGDHGAAYEFEFEAGKYPLKLCVFGGHQLLYDGYRTATLIHAKDIAKLATALSEVTEEWFHERFFELPPTQLHAIKEPEFRWVWESFAELRIFFQQVGCTGQSVICTISH
jgi:hypothetical protein